ncbi:MAG: histidinol dehydrogenase [Candidatus Helarchaeota archaeon]
MVKILTKEDEIKKLLDQISSRGRLSYQKYKDKIEEIINNVKNNGDSACLIYTEKFDGIKLDLDELLVSESEIQDAYTKLDDKTIESIRRAKRNIEKFHRIQLNGIKSVVTEVGVEVKQIFVPYERVGIYIPGGTANYPSTVLMTAIPAKIAGVNEIIMTTPPNNEKKVSPAVLIAANESGVNKIYRIGGAQAIAALAYGTESIPKVEKIVGPGNIYVNIAKLLVNNDVAIDLPAGPSEILIIADSHANSKFISADIISQAEHDPNTFTFLVSNSKEIIDEVFKLLKTNLKNYKRSEIIAKSLQNNCYLFYTESIESMFQISNIIAPEHLEIHLEDPEKYLPLVKNAGAIFLGPYSPVVVGDYAAGSNHVLPTGGLAKYHSGLSTYSFGKFIDVVFCKKQGLINLKDTIISLTDIEGLEAHKKAMLGRLEE